MIDKNYAGMDGFVWWMGIVESRSDPLGLGRCRVRVYSWQSESLSDIPSEDLPWAHPVNSLNSGSFTTPKEADMVFGFFADGKNAQIPIILGIVPNFQSVIPNQDIGFNDTRSLSEIKKSPKKLVSRTYKTDGTGIVLGEANTADAEILESLRYPHDDQINRPSITGLARNDLNDYDVISSRKSKSSPFITTADSQKFRQPTPAYAPKYPFNQVTESESGHSLEFDDTPGNERVTLAHRSGSFAEYYPNGTKVEEVVKNNYKIVMSDDHIHIMGHAFVTIDSDVYIRSKGDIFIEGGNNLDIKVSGKMNLSVGEELNIKAKSLNIDLDDSATVVTGGSQFYQASGGINLNSSNDVRVTAASGIDLLSEGNSNIEALGNLNMIGGILNLNSGGAATLASVGEATGIDSPSARMTKNDNPQSIDGPTNFEITSMDDDFELPIATYNKLLKDYGLPSTDTNTATPLGEPTTPPAGGSVKNVNCGLVQLVDDYSKVQLSPNFNLAQFTQNGSRKLQDQFGLTASEILCNLINLCINILEPIKAAGYDFKINSGFRREGDVPQSSSKSDHYFGRAADLSFTSMSSFDAANKIYPIVGNITKQFLLEYETSGGNGWIHVAYDGGKKHALPLATFNNHSVYAANKLVNLKSSKA
ncbi:hypothetical protein UFOVP49_14 [uncultured Caudovirales phage]|uniref:Protein Gp5, N-terminal OB-fold domain containing protein n=1 Tax=uncultured Caudovirales phage TaxID=2100421 RepID=A0A6J5KNX5_9CAUD|nr:hypothetical protein UFOVP49_14 [uncultured Caudovirales phage]